MKKGCFIKGVVIVTILIAAVVYIIQYKLDDWFFKPAKKIIISEVAENWENEFRYINDSAQKDSLKMLLIYYLENVKSMKDVVNLDEEFFIKEFDKIVEDSIITDNEISLLTMQLKKENNEKPESN
ncbi:MAG: hypothetical protein HXY48_04315 [Ignavibacteriaceae bacterium]|nr:hypothetical protein [Ignavibacteriaceae bacterium]